MPEKAFLIVARDPELGITYSSFWTATSAAVARQKFRADCEEWGEKDEIIHTRQVATIDIHA